MWYLRRVSTSYFKAPGFNIATFRAWAGLGPDSTNKEDRSFLSDCHLFSKPCDCIIPLSNKLSIRSLSLQAGARSSTKKNDEDCAFDSTFDLSSFDVSLQETLETDPRIDTEEDAPKTGSLKAPSGLLKLILEKPGPSIFGALDKYVEGKELSRDEVYKALSILRRGKLFKKALQLSEWIKGREDFNFSERDYASLLDLIAKVHGHQKAESYVEDIPKSFRGEVVYRTLLANFASSILVNKSEQLFNKMKDLGFPLTTFTCNQMLLLYMKIDKRKMEKVIMMMERENLKPSLFTYEVLIDARGRMNDIQGMEHIYEKIIFEGLEPTVHMLAILAKHYTVAGLTEKAEAVLKKLERNDSTSINFIRSLVLPIYADLGKANEVDRIWKSIESPQQAEYLAAICAFGKLKNLAQVETIFNEMAKKYKKPTSRHYTTMLKVYAENKMLGKVKELLKQMRDDGCYIGQVTWDVIVKFYVDVGEVEKADSMLLNATLQDKSFQPMFSSYMAILDAYSKRGDVHNAEKMFQMMKQDGYVARAQPFRALLQTYINAEVPAYGIRGRMKAYNIYPSKGLSEQLALVEPFSETNVSSELHD